MGRKKIQISRIGDERNRQVWLVIIVIFMPWSTVTNAPWIDEINRTITFHFKAISTRFWNDAVLYPITYFCRAFNRAYFKVLYFKSVAIFCHFSVENRCAPRHLIVFLSRPKVNSIIVGLFLCFFETYVSLSSVNFVLYACESRL